MMSYLWILLLGSLLSASVHAQDDAAQTEETAAPEVLATVNAPKAGEPDADTEVGEKTEEVKPETEPRADPEIEADKPNGDLGVEDSGAEVPADTGVEVPATTDIEAEVPAITDTGAEVPASTDTGAEVPADTEAEVPAGTDTGAEVPADTGAEVPAGTDTGAEVPTDTEAEVPADTGAKVPVDTGAKVPADTGAEVPTDTGAAVPADTEAEVPADTEAEVPTDTEAVVPAGTEAEVPADTGVEVPADTGAKIPASTDSGAEAPVDTSADVPVDSGAEVPASKDTAAEVPASKDTAAEVPASKDTAAEVPASKDTAAEVPADEDTDATKLQKESDSNEEAGATGQGGAHAETEVKADDDGVSASDISGSDVKEPVEPKNPGRDVIVPEIRTGVNAAVPADEGFNLGDALAPDSSQAGKSSNLETEARAAGAKGDAEKPEGKEASSGPLAGVLSAIIVAAIGAVAGYFTYQQKKLCFKSRQEADPEAARKADPAEAQSEPQVLSNLLNSS